MKTRCRDGWTAADPADSGSSFSISTSVPMFVSMFWPKL
jgi:hypothetical protein